MLGMSANQLIKWQPPYVPSIIEGGILPEKSKLLLYGKYETWKSMLAMHTAFTVAEGRPWFGFKTNKATSYTVQNEIAKKLHRLRIIKYTTGNKISYNAMEYMVIFHTDLEFKLDKPYCQSLLEKDLESMRPSLLIVDPVYSNIVGRQTDEYDVGKFLDKINHLSEKYGMAVILIHHERKSQIVDGSIFRSSEDVFGSAKFLNWCDSAVRTTKLDTHRIELSFEKVRHSETGTHKSIVVEINPKDLTFSTLLT